MPGWETREVFHRPGPDRLAWTIYLAGEASTYIYGAEIIGPVGTPVISSEKLSVTEWNEPIPHA